MAKVLMYTKTVCPYCVKAKQLFSMLGQDVEEVNLTDYPGRIDEMLEKNPAARTVPQIFINDELIGGCDDLYALHEKEDLKPLLGK